MVGGVDRRLNVVLGLQDKLTGPMNAVMNTFNKMKTSVNGATGANKKLTNSQGQAQSATESLNRKNTFLREQSERMGVTTGVVEKAMREVDVTFNSAGEAVGRAGKQIRVTNNLMDKGKVAAKGFQFGWLSVMFAGMALSRVFGGMVRAQLQLFGITELFSSLLTLVMLPVMMLLLPLFLLLFGVFSGLPDEVKLGIGIFIILMAVFGAMLTIVGQVMLAFMGFALIGSTAAATVMLWMVGLTLILFGVILIIVGVMMIVRAWGKDWRQVIAGMILVLGGLALAIIGVLVIMSIVAISTALLWAAIIIAVIAVAILIVKKWEWVKDMFQIAWEIMKNVFFSIWNAIVSFYQAKLNIIIGGINFLVRALNLIPGINIPLVPKVDFSRFKAELTDIGFLSRELETQRIIRARALEAAKTKKKEEDGGLLDNVIPPQFRNLIPGNGTLQPTPEVNVTNNNTFNVSDKEEMQKMIDANTAKIVEDLKRQTDI